MSPPQAAPGLVTAQAASRPLATFGFTEWFRRGEFGRVEEALQAMTAAGARHLRTHLSWAEYHTPGGCDWYDWLLPKCAERLALLPCIHYTPPSLSRTGASSGPPIRLQDYADFIDLVLTRYGAHFEAVELWNEPNNLLDWDWRQDPDWLLFSEMIGAAASWAQRRGVSTVLGGPAPFDANWLRLMGERGVLGVMSAIGLHGFPGTWDSEGSAWSGWDHQIAEMRKILAEFNPAAEIWITEAGYSTWRHDELRQAQSFLAALSAPADRLYWYGWQDIDPEVPVQQGLRFDPRHYHMGTTTADGRPKLLSRLLTEGGLAQVADIVSLSAPQLTKPANPILILGGAGFIGSNLADSYLADGQEVMVLDNLSRPGVEQNLLWLKSRHGDQLHSVAMDVRDEYGLREVVRHAGAVFHFAAQVAVTTSLEHPVEDFDVNARGTLNVLEAVRAANRPIPAIFASTNKVYGALEDLSVTVLDDIYQPSNPAMAACGVDETRPLDFCTPYGCSKGAADQYVLDYAKSYGLPTAVLRMSCIYGPRQFGTEDQGWVAHFLIRAMRGEPITIYGDGKQVRDILHVYDAVAAYRSALNSIGRVTGRAFNLGGGPVNAVSLRMVLREIAKLLGRDVELSFEAWRKGDQPYFVADTRRLGAALGWEAHIGWRLGLTDLHRWLRHSNRALAEPAFRPPLRPQETEDRRVSA